MLKEILTKMELFCEWIELVDPLMIFPSHRKLKKEWEKQNIKLDIKKLRKHKQEKRRKNYEKSKNRNKK